MPELQDLHTWEDKASWVRSQRDDSLAKVQPPLNRLPEQLPLNSQKLAHLVLSDREIEITENYSVAELLVKLRSREILAEEVTKAFLRRAAVAQLAVSGFYALSRQFLIRVHRLIVLLSFSGTKRLHERNTLTLFLSRSDRCTDSRYPRKNIMGRSKLMVRQMHRMSLG